MCLFNYRMAQTTEWLPAILGYKYNYKNNRYLPGNNRNVLEHNRHILGELGNSIIGKIKSIMYQCLYVCVCVCGEGGGGGGGEVN